jgi:hypothetical protein
MAPITSALVAVTFRQATVNSIYAGQMKDGSNNVVASDLLISSNKGLYLQANGGGAAENIYLDGAAYSTSGIIGTTTAVNNLTISTLSGDIFLNPHSQYVRSASALTLATQSGTLTLNTASQAIFTDSTLKSSNATATLTSVGVDCFITSDHDTNVHLEAGLRGKVLIDSDLDLGTGNLSALNGGLNLTAASGDITLQAGASNKIVFESEAIFQSGMGTGNGGLTFSSASGKIAISPNTYLEITAPVHSVSGIVEAIGASLQLTTDGDNIVLQPGGSGTVQVESQLNTDNGTINGTTSLNLTSGSGDISISPAAGQRT